MQLEGFYPTPNSLIRRMLKDVCMDKVQHVLEPSAGKGDICDYITKHQHDREYRHREISFDVIEINPDLQHILRGKNYHLVQDDFLNFDTRKVYDLIVANFPFREGDRHLEKALALMERNGGQLVCLVNAETIRNPYTNLRKTLVTKLDRLSADVEYIESAFANAERPTGVEVALVRVTIEKDAEVSVLLEHLQQARQVEDVETPLVNDLIDRDYRKAAAARFNYECALGIKLIGEYYALRPYIKDRLPRPGDSGDDYSSPLIELKIQDGHPGDNRAESINAYLCGVRDKYWSALIRDPQFKSTYTSNILDELRHKLTDLRQYDFNLFNIRELERELAAKITQGIEQSILVLFETFSRKYAYGDDFNEGNIHYYNGWKTNKAHKVNSKIIIPLHGISAWSKCVDYDAQRKLADMVKVFNYLSDSKVDVPQLIDWTCSYADQVGRFTGLDLRYFDVSLYKKGTCHIRFTDQYLLDKFNIFGSQRKGWLPPSYGKKSYVEMDEEEKAVIDSFQGQEKYEEVYRNAARYIVDPSTLLLSAAND